MAAQLPKYHYRLDASDAIEWVDDLWLGFARENGAADLTRKSVLGRSLWDFVAGKETRELFQLIHARVRSSGLAAVLPFRCDSPLLKRYMRLRITRQTHGRLYYESVLLRAEPRHYLRLLDPAVSRSESLVTLCSCCKRALLEPVGWLEIEDIVARLRLLESSQTAALRHSICPQCASAVANSPENGSVA